MKGSSLLFFLALFFSELAFAESSCVAIPSDYGLYSSDAIRIQDSSIKVNGNSIGTGNYSPKVAIDKNGNLTTNTNLTLPALDPASFPSNSATNDVTSNSDITINSSSEVFYDKIRLKDKDDSITLLVAAHSISKRCEQI